MRCEKCGKYCECDTDFQYGDIVRRHANGWTLTGSSLCRVINTKEENGELFLWLELVYPEEDPELVKLLALPDSWHRVRCGWKHDE